MAFLMINKLLKILLLLDNFDTPTAMHIESNFKFIIGALFVPCAISNSEHQQTCPLGI